MYVRFWEGTNKLSGDGDFSTKKVAEDIVLEVATKADGIGHGVKYTADAIVHGVKDAADVIEYEMNTLMAYVVTETSHQI